MLNICRPFIKCFCLKTSNYISFYTYVVQRFYFQPTQVKRFCNTIKTKHISFNINFTSYYEKISKNNYSTYRIYEHMKYNFLLFLSINLLYKIYKI